MVNYNSILSPRNLTAGWSGSEKKQQQRQIIGQFGDGLKSAISVFNRVKTVDGYPALHIQSVGYRYEFRMHSKQNCPAVLSLHYSVRNTNYDHANANSRYATTSYNNPYQASSSTPVLPPSLQRDPELVHILGIDPTRDTVVQMRGVRFNAERYLFLQHSYERLRPPLIDRRSLKPKENEFEILVENRFRGGIYVKSMQVCDPSPWAKESKAENGGKVEI